jgi:hypothetical protein
VTEISSSSEGNSTPKVAWENLRSPAQAGSERNKKKTKKCMEGVFRKLGSKDKRKNQEAVKKPLVRNQENTNKRAMPKIKPMAWVWTGILVIGTPVVARLPLKEGTVILIDSALGNLVSLIIFITGAVLIAKQQWKGWLWLAGFFYSHTFAHTGVAAWAYLGLTGACLYCAWRWLKKVDTAHKPDALE